MANTNQDGIPTAGYSLQAGSQGVEFAGRTAKRSPNRLSAPSLGASGAEMFALVILLVFYLLVPVGATPDMLEMLNTTNMLGAVAFTVIVLAGAVRSARANSAMVFTAPFWFRISAATYFGFGNLTPFLGNDTTISYLNHFAYLEPSTLLKVNIVVAFGTLSALAVMTVLQRVMPTLSVPHRAPSDHGSLRSVAAVAAVVGFSVKYLFLVPYQLGAFPGLTLPGVVHVFGFLPDVAIFLLALWALKRGGLMILVPITLLALEILGGLLMGQKSVVILAAVMFALGVLCDRFTLRRVLISTALVAGLFTVVGPPTDAVRRAMLARYGSIDAGTLVERLNVLASYSKGGSQASNKEEVQGALVRMSYSTPAGFAISQNDIGLPGNSYELWLAVVVPRVLWRDKPVVTDVGVDFNEAATGSRRSSSSPGLFGEAYWNFGWAGVAIFMSLYGAALFFLGRYSLWVIQSGSWWFLPVALIAMRTGMRIDGWFVADVVGGGATILMLHLITTFALRLWGTAKPAQGTTQPAWLS